MKAHLITIGDEILIGQTLNTNAAYIGEQISILGITVTKTSVVGDELESIKTEYKLASEKNDLIIVTGGLGPTHDDVTRTSVVEYFHTTLITNEDVLHDINERFSRFNRKVTASNEDQANVPANAAIIRNKKGTAPGYWIETQGKIFVFMPGVPIEMKTMMQNFVLPKLTELNLSNPLVTRRLTLMTTGIPESTLSDKLGDMNELLGESKLAFLPSHFGVKLRITSTGSSEEEALNKISDIEQRIRSVAGRYIYGKGEEELADVVGRLLRERGSTVATAESCTGGNIANQLTNINGSSAYFERGIIAYSNGAKVELLNVSEDVIAEYGAVSEQVARLLSEGARSISGTDYGIGITGILGPTGGTAEKPVGTVYISVTDDEATWAKKYQFGDERLMNKDRATQAALEMLRRKILGISLDV